jgi:hypothetical protein
MIIFLALLSCGKDTADYHFISSVSKYDIILVIGLSNTHQGIGLDKTLDAPDPDIFQFGRYGMNNFRIIQAAEPLDHLSKLPGCIGFALTFAKSYDQSFPEADRGILIIPGGMGGTGFANHCWNRGDTLYHDAVFRTKKILQHYNNRLVAILWHQGESDVGNAAYQSCLDSMIVHIRKDLGDSAGTVPFILGGLVPYWTDQDTARIRIDSILKNTVKRIPNTGFADPRVPWVIVKPDNEYVPVHFDAAGEREMGRRYFSEYRRLKDSGCQ